MKIWSYRIIATAAIVELAYLVLMNLALNLPYTQTLINQHKPEKFTVQWEKAWSWHPSGFMHGVFPPMDRHHPNNGRLRRLLPPHPLPFFRCCKNR